MRYDLAWGEPLIVRQALAETLGSYFIPNTQSIASLGYTNHYGDPKLIEQMKYLCLRQTGKTPKHLFVTNGCTGAINAAIHVLKTNNIEYVTTNKRYYPILPSIIKGFDLVQRTPYDKRRNFNDIVFLDSPSAPEGLVFPFDECDIYDAAYASKTYSWGGHVPQKYRMVCGSISKTLGLSGLRLGWIAFDDDGFVNPITDCITSSYAGLSCLSMSVTEQILSSLDIDRFEIKSANYLDDNRNEMQRLFNILGAGGVAKRGMFAILELGNKEKKLFDKVGIKYQSGETWGENENWVRLNLGASREIVKQAVKAVLK